VPVDITMLTIILQYLLNYTAQLFFFTLQRPQGIFLVADIFSYDVIIFITCTIVTLLVNDSEASCH